MRLGGSSLALSLCGLLVGTSGCVHPKAVQCAPPAEPAPPVVLSAPALPPALHDLAWTMRSGENTSWADAPSALVAFTVGRWECALGEVLSDDVLGQTDLDLRRARRLACTHVTGATVQTQLQCSLHGTRGTAAPSTGLAPASSAAPTDTTSDPTRELSLQLDGAPTLHVRCAPAAVAQLALISREKKPIASLCAIPGWLEECAPAPVAAADEADDSE